MTSVNFDPANVTRSLLRRSRQGALATLMADGAPYCSLVNVASDVDGSPILLLSRLALHTQNVLSDARVSLMLDERASGDPLEGARIMLAGTARLARDEDVPKLRRRYLNRHPTADVFVDFPDFSFFTIVLHNAHLVAGFGRIVDLPPERFVTDVTGAESLIAAEAEIIAHLNADHGDTLNLYAVHLLKADSGNWRCVGCDPDGLDLQSDQGAARLNFPRRVTDPAMLRTTLKKMADHARSPLL